MPVMMATAVAIGKSNVSKITPNITLTHTPPAPGTLPVFYGTNPHQDKIKK